MNFVGKEYELLDLMKRADEGDVDAMRDFVTLCYTHQDEGMYEATKDKWLKYVKKMAEEENAVGYIWLGDAFKTGVLGEKNIPKAIEHYQKAAENGMEFGYECIAEIYFAGNGVPKDYEKAYDYIMKSANPSSSSCYILGEMYRQGLYVEENMELAKQYYEQAAERGSFAGNMDDYAELAAKRLESGGF